MAVVFFVHYVLTLLFFSYFIFREKSVLLLANGPPEGDEAGGVGGPDAGPAVLHELVGVGELACPGSGPASQA